MPPTSPFDFTPPASIEAEQSVLGSMLIRRAAVEAAAEMLTAADFYRDAHAAIFAAIRRLRDERRPVDRVTVPQMLKDSGDMERVGGLAYLQSLFAGASPHADVDAHCRIVKDKSLRRQLAAASLDVLARSTDEGQAIDDVLEASERQVFAVKQGRAGQESRAPLRAILEGVFEKSERASTGEAAPSGVRTEIGEIDHIVNRMQPTDLITLAARPKIGKTGLAIRIGLNVAKQGHPVYMASMEMSREQIGKRVACMLAKVGGRGVDEGDLTPEEWGRFGNAIDRAEGLPFDVDDTPAQSLSSLRSGIRRFQSERGGLGLVIVDYLQLVTPPRDVRNRVQEVDEIVYGLKQLAGEFRAPVIAISQLNRSVESRENKRPQLSDLRESGGIEAASNMVWMLYREDYYRSLQQPGFMQPEVGEAEVIVAANRNGPTGIARVGFMSRYADFCDLARIGGSDF